MVRCVAKGITVPTRVRKAASPRRNTACPRHCMSVEQPRSGDTQAAALTINRKAIWCLSRLFFVHRCEQQRWLFTHTSPAATCCCGIGIYGQVTPNGILTCKFFQAFADVLQGKLQRTVLLTCDSTNVLSSSAGAESASPQQRRWRLDECISLTLWSFTEVDRLIVVRRRFFHFCSIVKPIWKIIYDATTKACDSNRRLRHIG